MSEAFEFTQQPEEQPAPQPQEGPENGTGPEGENAPEEQEKKPEQTTREFQEDLDTLAQLWRESGQNGSFTESFGKAGVLPRRDKLRNETQNFGAEFSGETAG